MTLDEIAIKHGTDKATVHPSGGHGYAPHYDRLFTRVRHDCLSVLEIGVGGGESIKTWLDYFPKAEVCGVDIVQDTNPYNTAGSGVHERYTFCPGDQSMAGFWQRFIGEQGGDWDIIIDDGSHRNDHIIVTFCALWSHLKPGGFYCVEDLAVGYSPGSVFIQPGWPGHADFFKAKLDEVLQGKHEIDWMTLSHELAVIRKRPL